MADQNQAYRFKRINEIQEAKSYGMSVAEYRHMLAEKARLTEAEKEARFYSDWNREVY